MAAEGLLAMRRETMQSASSWQLGHQIEQRLRPRYLQRRDAALERGDATQVAHWEAKPSVLEQLVGQLHQVPWGTTLTMPESPAWPPETSPALQ